LPSWRNPTGFDKSRPSLQRDRMSANRVSAALRRARSRSRNYHSMRRFDRDIKPTSQACSPAISGDACTHSARRRRSRADIRRRRVGVASARQGGIAKAIAASSRRRCLALRQGVKAATQSAVFIDVTAAILVRARHGRCGTAKKCCAGDRRGAKSQKLFHVLSPEFVRGLEGPRETRPSRPAFELVEGCESGSPETAST